MTPVARQQLVDRGATSAMFWHWQMWIVCQPLADEPVIRLAAGLCSVPAEIVIAAVERDDGLAGSSVTAVGGYVIFVVSGHRATSKTH
jgi:hypothetical protein